MRAGGINFLLPFGKITTYFGKVKTCSRKRLIIFFVRRKLRIKNNTRKVFLPWSVRAKSFHSLNTKSMATARRSRTSNLCVGGWQKKIYSNVITTRVSKLNPSHHINMRGFPFNILSLSSFSIRRMRS